MVPKRSWLTFIILVFLFCLTASPSSAQTNSSQCLANPGFSYQGQLIKNNVPIAGTCNFTFSLWDAATGGNQIGGNQIISEVPISNGIFNVTLNDAKQFGSTPFDGSARYLEISVTCPGDSGPTILGRQAITFFPYANYGRVATQVA